MHSLKPQGEGLGREILRRPAAPQGHRGARSAWTMMLTAETRGARGEEVSKLVRLVVCLEGKKPYNTAYLVQEHVPTAPQQLREVLAHLRRTCKDAQGGCLRPLRRAVLVRLEG